MKVVYDIETDILNLILNDNKVIESDEVEQDIILDYNDKGKVVSIEVLNASDKVTQPFTMAYEIEKLEKKKKKAV